MTLDKVTKQRIHDLSILEVADKLSLKYSSTGTWRKALCFCHNDHTPSLGLNVTSNSWKCFVCGEGGSLVDLVMKHENLSYPDACEWLIKEFGIPVPQQKNRQNLLNAIKSKLMNYSNDNVDANANSSPFTLNSSLLEKFKGTSNEFTRALVQTGILTQAQMQHASETFHLSTADDNVIFWQIDQDNHIREGKVMYYQADCHRSHTRNPVTVSWLLKHEKQLPEDWKAKPCLFGLHQLAIQKRGDSPITVPGTVIEKTWRFSDVEPIIAVVESEKTAIICSELIPTLNDTKVYWLATGGKSNLTQQTLQPIIGRRVILFPDTDSKGEAYNDWLSTAKQINNSRPLQKGQRRVSITVSNLLELHATENQKKRKIDIADFIIESKGLNV